VLLAVFAVVLEGRLGSALRLINTYLSKTTPGDKGVMSHKTLVEEKIAVLNALGWAQWSLYERTWILIKYPKSFTLF